MLILFLISLTFFSGTALAQATVRDALELRTQWVQSLSPSCGDNRAEYLEGIQRLENQLRNFIDSLRPLRLPESLQPEFETILAELETLLKDIVEDQIRARPPRLLAYVFAGGYFYAVRFERFASRLFDLAKRISGLTSAIGRLCEPIVAAESRISTESS